MADRVGLGSIRIPKGLSCLTGWRTPIEILGDFARLATPFRRKSGTKNPAGVAARGGVQNGLGSANKADAFLPPRGLCCNAGGAGMNRLLDPENFVAEKLA